MHTDELVSVAAHKAVSDCPAAEAISLIKGVDIEAFSELNEIVLGIASNLTHPLFRPHLLVYHQAEDGLVILARIEARPPISGCTLAVATCELPGTGTDVVELSLMLEPALLPEGSGV